MYGVLSDLLDEMGRAKGKQTKGRFGRKGKDEDDDDPTTGVSSMASSITGSPSSSSSGTLDQPLEGSNGVLNMAHIHKPFKKPGREVSRKTKTFKQIINMEKAKDWKIDTPTYWNIEALPSMTPQKKYCDITGLEARYTDPKTRLRYHSTEVYQLIKNHPISSVQQYLGLRNAAVVLK